MQNDVEDHTATIDFVRNTLLIDHFCKIISICDNCRIIPLKGISLLFTIYKEGYSRNVGDIDILIAENKTEEFIDNLSGMGYILRSPKTIRLKSKRKFDMIHHNAQYCDLDIHVDLVSKKFFRLSVGDFTSFALSRLRKTSNNNTTVHLLSPIDEWIYLAQHYCFHLFSNDKWLKDLYLIQSHFSNEDIAELISIAKRFRFERVITAVYRCLKQKYNETEIKIPEIVVQKRLIFDLLFCKPNQKFAYTFPNRIIAIYWEFLFIDDNQSRVNAYWRLLFPKPAVLSDIYNFKSQLFCFLYPVHLILVCLSSIVFFPLLLWRINPLHKTFMYFIHPRR
jgi:hypothetical protein